MRLGIITLDFAVRISSTYEVVDAHDLDLSGVSLTRARTILSDAAAFNAPVVQLLLSLELLLKLGNIRLLSVERLLEAGFEFLFELRPLFLSSGLPFPFLLLEIVNLLLQHLNV